MPQLQASTSISPLCLSSFDSPLISPSLRNMSTATVNSFGSAFYGKDCSKNSRRGLGRGLGQSRDHAQRHVHAFQLVVRDKPEHTPVVPRIFFVRDHLN